MNVSVTRGLAAFPNRMTALECARTTHSGPAGPVDIGPDKSLSPPDFVLMDKATVSTYRDPDVS